MSNPKFVRNEVTYITNEIDYDKLAEAIVKANQTLACDKQIDIIQTDENNKGKYLTKALSSFCFLFLRCVAAFLFFIDALLIASLFVVTPTLDWFEQRILPNILTFLIFIYLILMIGMYAILLWKAAREVSEETDKNFMVSLFSGVVSFAALIVSLVALLQTA